MSAISVEIPLYLVNKFNIYPWAGILAELSFNPNFLFMQVQWTVAYDLSWPRQNDQTIHG